MTKLSICIPTYKRPSCLRECIESIAISLQENANRVEILVSDDGSHDSTESVVNSLQASIPSLKFRKNEVNLGVDKHFPALAHYAQGEYIWFFGDDDRVSPEAISQIFKRIDQNADLIICNYSIWDREFTSILKNRGLSLAQDQVFLDPNKVLSTFGLHLGYMSSVIAKRAQFCKYSDADYDRFLGFGFPLLYAVYAQLKQGSRVIYIEKSIVYNRSNNSGNYDWHHYFIKGSSFIFDCLRKSGYSRRAVWAAKHLVLCDFVVTNVIGMKLHQVHKPGLLKMLFKCYKWDWLFWTVCLPITCLPFKTVWSMRTRLEKLPPAIAKMV